VQGKEEESGLGVTINMVGSRCSKGGKNFNIGIKKCRMENIKVLVGGYVGRGEVGTPKPNRKNPSVRSFRKKRKSNQQKLAPKICLPRVKGRKGGPHESLMELVKESSSGYRTEGKKKNQWGRLVKYTTYRLTREKDEGGGSFEV